MNEIYQRFSLNSPKNEMNSYTLMRRLQSIVNASIHKFYCTIKKTQLRTSHSTNSGASNRGSSLIYEPIEP